jgi:hypothetical protein
MIVLITVVGHFYWYNNLEVKAALNEQPFFGSIINVGVQGK